MAGGSVAWPIGFQGLQQTDGRDAGVKLPEIWFGLDLAGLGGVFWASTARFSVCKNAAKRHHSWRSFSAILLLFGDEAVQKAFS
jgi:hypothetical protein